VNYILEFKMAATIPTIIAPALATISTSTVAAWGSIKDFWGVNVPVDYMPGGGGFRSIQQAQRDPQN